MMHDSSAMSLENLRMDKSPSDRSSISSDVIFDSSPHSVYELRSQSRYKRFKTHLLTYLRQNYLIVIKLLVLLALLLFVIVAIFIFIVFSHRAEVPVSVNNTVTINSSSSFSFINSSGTKVKTPIDFTSSVLVPDSDMDVPSHSFSKIPCRRVKCLHNCTVSVINYATIKELSCCNCFPQPFRLVRYTHFMITDLHVLTFEVKTDLSIWTQYNLKTIVPFPVDGTWDIAKESDSSMFLVLKGVRPLSRDD